MSVFIPSKQTKKYSAANNGDLFGNLVRTRNLDFNKKGYLSLAGKPNVFYTEAQDADFQTPIAIASDSDSYYVITSDHFFTLSLSLHNFSISEKTSGTPPGFSFNSDYAFYTEDIHVSGTTSVCSYDLSGDTWTSRITGLSSSYPHPLCVSEHQQYLAVGNGNSVRLYDSGYNLITTCTVPAAQIVTWIRWKGNLLYFGTRNYFGGEARMYVWNGSGTAAQAGYGVGSAWAMSGCEYEDTIVVASQNGRLLRFSGNGFVSLRTNDGQEVNFPIYYTKRTWTSSASNTNLLSPVASRGMIAKGSRIYMNVASEIGSNNGDIPNYLINFPSGLWVFDPDIGLYHKGGVDHQQMAKVTVSGLNGDILELPAAQVFETGDPVATGTLFTLTGVDSNKIYYAIKVDSTHLKLANTPYEAQAGAAMTLGGSLTSEQLIFAVYKSCGSVRVDRGGPVALINETEAAALFLGSEVLYGSEVNNNTGTTVGTVMSLGMGRNVGSFVTPKIQAENVTDLFKKLIAKFGPLNYNTRKIIVKYRTALKWGSPGRQTHDGFYGAVWINSNSFTVNPKNTDVYALAVGDEIEIQYGAAGGYTAHVSAITVNSSTDWTITLDESMPDVAASDQSVFVHENWTKYKTISNADDLKAAVKGFANYSFGKNAKWVQLKIELRGYADYDDTLDLEEVMLLSGADQKYA